MLVRYCMQKAGIYGSHSNFFYSHIVSVAFAAGAVAMSFFNTISYFLRAPFNIILNVVQFNPIGAVVGLISDCTNVIRSLVFVSLGVTFIVAGLLFPKAIFSHFAPEYYNDLETRLREEVNLLNNRIVWLEKEYRLKEEQLAGAHKVIDDQKKTILNLQPAAPPKTSPKKPFWKFC